MEYKPHILVLGDAMLDTYIHGSVSRVSPEAPILCRMPERKGWPSRRCGQCGLQCGGDYAPGDVREAIFTKRLVLVPLAEGHSTIAILEHMKG